MGWISERRSSARGARRSKKPSWAKPQRKLSLPRGPLLAQELAEDRWKDQKQTSLTSDKTKGWKPTIAETARRAMASRSPASATSISVKAQRRPLRLPPLLSNTKASSLGVTASAMAAKVLSLLTPGTARAHATSASSAGSNSATRAWTTVSAMLFKSSRCGLSALARSQSMATMSLGGNFSGMFAMLVKSSSVVRTSPQSFPTKYRANETRSKASSERAWPAACPDSSEGMPNN
mmetsp:Transcript_130785/g.292574  ORF Transcript_130785/g.292574 Transcript_130785/m.292574 type:complete len:235 (-) Transcript_130785:248-952(-)